MSCLLFFVLLKFIFIFVSSCLILSSFARHILSQEFTDPIKYFILPALSTVPNFPYNLLIKFLAEFQQSKTDDVMIVDGTDFYRDRISRDEEPIYSPYLLYSVLVMDRLHLGKFFVCFLIRIRGNSFFLTL